MKRSLQCLQEITDGCCMSMAAVRWRQGVTLEPGGEVNILLYLTHINKEPSPCFTCPWLLSIITAPLYNKFTKKNLPCVLSALPYLSLLNPTPISKLPLSTTCTGANPQVRFRSMYLTTPQHLAGLQYPPPETIWFFGPQVSVLSTYQQQYPSTLSLLEGSRPSTNLHM